jgi:peptidoglycan/xylan/chitin deacetylase (PgdA/CDA1 family)
MFEFAIRDDDPNYFTDPDELKRAYADLPTSIPISFAVVPFHGCTKTLAIPEGRWEGNKEFPIGENKKLITYLQKELENGSASVMLHGYNHIRYSEGPEFVAGENLQDRVKKGREYLEELLDVDINIFVPPNNSFSRTGLKAIKDENLRTFYYPTPLNRPKTPEVLTTFGRDLLFKYRHRNGGLSDFAHTADRFWRQEDRSVFMPVRPWTYTLQGEPEFTCVSMTRGDSIEPIKRQMEIADRYDAKFCLAIHYHALRSDSFRNSFYELIEYARSELDPRFVRAEALF